MTTEQGAAAARPPADRVASRSLVGSAQPIRASRSATEAFLLLLGTHFLVDCFSSALPTVQPLLVDRFGLSLAQAGLIGGLWMFSSSVLQLPFGLLSDRLQSRHFTVLSPIVAAVCLSSMGLAANISGVIALLLAGGMAVAAYHPYSTSQAGRISGGRKAIGTAIFITFGTAGLGLGPLYLTAVIERIGFDQLWVSSLPVLALTPVLLWRIPQPGFDSNSRRRGVDWMALREHSGPLVTLYALVVLRSIVQVGLAQFLALYMVQVRGAEFSTAAMALAAYFLSTSVGSFVGGAAAHRFGGCNVIIASCAGAGPILALFMSTEGWLSISVLFVGGVVLLASIPVNVVMAQDLVPSQAGGDERADDGLRVGRRRHSLCARGRVACRFHWPGGGSVGIHRIAPSQPSSRSQASSRNSSGNTRLAERFAVVSPSLSPCYSYKKWGSSARAAVDLSWR